MKKNKILDYRWNDLNLIKKDYKKAIFYYNLFLNDLHKNLNKYHKSKYSRKFWDIVIGPWLIEFIVILIDRYFAIKKINDNENYYLEYQNIRQEDCIPKNYYSSRFIYQEEAWNNFMFCNYIKNFFPKLRLKKVTQYYSIKQNKIKYNLIFIKFIFRIFSKFFFSKNKIFLQNTSLSFFYELKLRFKLNFFSIFPEYNTNNNKTDYDFRKIKNNKKKNILNFFKDQIYLNLPKSYLEDFSMIKSYYNNITYLNNFKIIFTTIDHIFNDNFKIWMAESFEKNRSKIIIGQHGGGYNIINFAADTDLEEKRYDFFVYWGTFGTVNKKKSISLFNLKTSGNSFYKMNLDPFAFITIIQNPPPKFSRFLRTSELYFSQMEEYNEVQLNLLTSLSKNSLSSVAIKFYDSKLYKYNQNFFLKKYPNLKYFSHDYPIKKLYKNSRVIICNSLVSTSFLECLSLNKPVIILRNHSSKSFKNDFNKNLSLMNNMGLIYDNPIKLAAFLNRGNEAIAEWWYSNNFQLFLKKIRKEISNYEKDPVEKLSNFLIRKSFL